MVFSAERDRGEDGGVQWRMPGLKDGPALGARVIALAEQAARAHEARAAAGGDRTLDCAAGARTAPAPARSASVRWAGVAEGGA
jgi:hypothetical protein